MENSPTIGEPGIESEDLSLDDSGTKKTRRASLLKRRPMLAIVFFAIANGGLLAIGAGGLDRFVFVLTSLLTGFVLNKLDAPLYVEFTLGLWMFAPFIRRVADYEGGFRDPSIFLLAPFLVTLISVLRLRGLLRSRTRALIFPIVLIASALFLGINVGLLNGEVSRTAQAIVNWVAPICFGLYIAQLYPQYPRLRASIQRSLLVCGCIIGVYGVYQFLVAPAWDCAWMENVYINLVPPSFGQPEPLGIRVFSTLNSPGVVSTYLMVILSVAVSQPGWKGLFVAAPAATSLLLSQDRTAWLSWALCMLVLLILPARSTAGLLRRRVIWIVASVSIVGSFLLFTPPFDQIIGQRLDTLQSLDQDGSLAERKGEYMWVLNYMENKPMGIGISSAPEFNRMPVDGGPMHLLLSFGWPGAVVFSCALAMLFFLMLFTPVPSDTLAAAARAILFGLCFQFFSGNILIGAQGILFWTCLGVFFASSYYRAKDPAGVALKSPRKGTRFEPATVAQN